MQALVPHSGPNYELLPCPNPPNRSLHRSSTMWACFRSLRVGLRCPVAFALVAVPFLLRDTNVSLSLSAIAFRGRTFVGRTAARASLLVGAVSPCRRAKRGGIVRSPRSLPCTAISGGVDAISPRFCLHGFRHRQRQANTAVRSLFRRHVVGRGALGAL